MPDQYIQAANLDSVHKSIVLLKNIDYSLPIQKANLQNVAIIGPNGNYADV